MSLEQLSRLLPLPNEELQQVLDYATTLSKLEAASHFSNLLGDSPDAVDFISSFNSKRDHPPIGGSSSSGPAQAPSESINAVPKSTKRHTKKKKADIHTPQARKVQEVAASSGTAYSKKSLSDLDYIPQTQKTSAPPSNDVSRSTTPKPAPKETKPSAGYLISDPPPKSKSKSNSSSRTSTPKPSGSTTKISISGGTPMSGQSTALKDLDAAIRALEITTNPTLDNPKHRKCNCVATRHPLQSAAPNCLSCGKVICMKEGLGPCTFCGASILRREDVDAMIKELKGERAKELMAADARANRKAEVSKTPAPFANKGRSGNTYVSNDPTIAEAEAKAKEHRDKLLGFQAQNAKRTTVRDEVADFDVSAAIAGTGSMWASPEERAKELKRQQKVLRELEWNARPDYEKRQQVLSIDLVGGKVVRKMAAVERPATPDSEEEEKNEGASLESHEKPQNGGAFSGNPLLGALIKPVFDAKGKGTELEGADSRPRKMGWRRVQDDLDNNEHVILDGGVRGHDGLGDEPECG